MPRVLIVEDTPSVRQWLLRMVARLAPECIAEGVADAATARRRVSSAVPDLIVLDVGLPREGGGVAADPMMGLELIRAWRAEAVKSRIVVVSSHMELADYCLELGRMVSSPRAAGTCQQSARGRDTGLLSHLRDADRPLRSATAARSAAGPAGVHGVSARERVRPMPGPSGLTYP